MDDLSLIFNRWEAGFWLVIALLTAGKAFHRKFSGSRVPGYHLVAAIAFALFGVSDIIECYTGSWWQPWWLLVMKVGCVATLILCLLERQKEQKREQAQSREVKGTDLGPPL